MEPFTDFPRNFDNLGDDIPDTVDIDLDTDGVEVKTSTLDTRVNIAQIPEKMRELFTTVLDTPMLDAGNGLLAFNKNISSLDISPRLKKKLQPLLDISGNLPDFAHVQNEVDNRFDQIGDAIVADIAENRKTIDDMIAWNSGIKSPEDIPMIASELP